MTRINVTKAFLPPLDEYHDYMEEIWASDQLTNQGPLLKQLEAQIKARLDLRQLQIVSNGTIALQLALRALDVTDGEVITTPFSYVATTSAILWEGCKPVFVDIEDKTFCMDPAKIEAAITDRTRAILPVHVFGNPCAVEEIEAIARKHGLPVIYDGAHAFGVTYKGKSLLSYGDISTCSFHATKPFHTIEGGALVMDNKEIAQKLELMKRFGHEGDEHTMLGINAKASEFQAAMGLCNLKYFSEIVEKRSSIVDLYNQLLGNKFDILRSGADVHSNHAYYPLLLSNEKETLKVIEALQAEDIFPRRYFYPALNTLPYLPDKQSCPVAEDIVQRILCLPLYAGLDEDDVQRICAIINSVHV